MPNKKPQYVFTQPLPTKGHYKIYSVATGEMLGMIKGENAKMYWEAFDTNNEFLMSGKRKKECMDYFREIDKKSRMAEGGGIDTHKNKKYSIEKLKNSIEDYLKENDISNLYFRVYDTSFDNVESYSIEPSPVTETKNKHLAGMQILWDSRENEFEVSEYQAGEKGDELWVYGTYSSIIPAVKSLLKGNSETGRKRSPEYDESGIRIKNIKHGKGGGIGFEKLSNQVAKEYEGDKVAPEYQDEYGKTYSKQEAKEVGDKVAGKVYWQQRGRKFGEGGEMDDYDYEDSYEDDDEYATGGSIESTRLKYAKKDIALVMKQGFMSIFGTKYGLLNLSYEDGIFIISDNKYNPRTESYNVLFEGDKKGAIEFVADSYVVENFANGGSMPQVEKTYYIILEDGSFKEFKVKHPKEIVGIYFTMGINGLEKGTPMVHFENALNPLYNEDGTFVDAMPEYAGKDYYDFNNKMAEGGNVEEDQDYYRVFRNNAGKDIAVKIVKDPIFGKFNYYVDGSLRGQFETFKQAEKWKRLYGGSGLFINTPQNPSSELRIDRLHQDSCTQLVLLQIP